MIKQNDPLLLNYGCLNNDLFLLDYGFVIHSNPYDCIELRYDGALLDAASMAAGVSSPSFSAPAPWQEDILSQLNFYGETPLLKVSALLMLLVLFWREFLTNKNVFPHLHFELEQKLHCLLFFLVFR